MTEQKQAVVVDQYVLNAVRQFTMKLSKRYDIARLVLFGSHARGDYHAESDVDLAIFLETDYYIQPLPVGNETNTTIFQYLNPLLLRNIRTEGIDIECYQLKFC